MKLLVWEEDTGKIEIEQRGATGQDVIDAYARRRRTARPFEGKHDIARIFMDGSRLRQRPSLNASLDRTQVPAGGTVKLRGVPAGAYVTVADGINSERHGPFDGKVIHLHDLDRGRRQIFIDAFPHLRQTLELIVE